MKRYNPKQIEPKWQKIWDEKQIYKPDLNSSKPKYYAMSMLNYPSGAGIHIGHAMNYTISDVMARFKRQQGFETYHPIGWDSFGLPAENYAIKTGQSPQKSMSEIIPHYHKQYKAMGWSNDWSRETATHEPEYYKWTQWIFCELFRRGLVYQDSRMQWWCSVDNTVLADEQVTADGKCWRHDGPNDPPAEKREIKQWFFKITDYADELLKAIDGLDWSDSVKQAQKNWIGKSEGAEIDFEVTGGKQKITVFTTRPDTIFGATFLVLAPEHELVGELITAGQKKAIETYKKAALQKSDIERQAGKEKTGVFTGSYAINPASGEKIPVWISEYVLMGYGTGAIMAVPAHDQRDYEFAKKFDLPVHAVIAQVFGKELPEAKNIEGVVVIGYDPKTKKYLGLKRNSGGEGSEYWLVGGGREDGEDFKDSAKRELAEEAGFKTFEQLIQLGDPVYSYYHNPIKNSNRCSLGVNFLAILDSKKAGATHQESHEDFELYWATFEELYGGIEKTNKDFGADHWLDALKKAKSAVEHISDDKQYKPEVYDGEGLLINSGKYDGISSSEAREQIVKDLAGFDFANDATVEAITNSQTGEEELVFTDVGKGAPKPDQPFEERQAVEVLVKHWSEDKYIGLRWKKIDWETIITGGIEEGQTAEEAAIAEIRQETGYQNPVLKKSFGVSHAKFYHGPKKVNRFAHFQVLFFELADDEHKEISDEEKEIHEVVWLRREEMDKFRLPDSQRYMWNLYQGRGGKARTKTIYRIRDWSVSRQRYWGAPVPIIHCKKCGPQLVPDDELPVVLPELKEFEPSGDGRSALARATDWLKVKCPTCGGEAERDTDTIDTYVDSAWYFLRYLDPKNSKAAFDSKLANKWMPVDFYNGADHATAHMIYARFITRFFSNIGMLDEPEPFKRFLFNGKVVDKDGKNFSKTKENGPDPLDIIADGYGADALRTYLMFAAPLDQYVRWDPKGVPGTYRFLNRLWNISLEFIESKTAAKKQPELLPLIHRTIKKVEKDIEQQHYNTAIAAMMASINELYKIKDGSGICQSDDWRFCIESMIQLVAPFAPFMASELWQQLGHEDMVHLNHWPKLNEKLAVETKVKVAIQVNGKLKGEIQLAAGTSESKAVAAAEAEIARHLAGKTVKKHVYVADRIVNFVV